MLWLKLLLNCPHHIQKKHNAGKLIWKYKMVPLCFRNTLPSAAKTLKQVLSRRWFHIIFFGNHPNMVTVTAFFRLVDQFQQCTSKCVSKISLVKKVKTFYWAWNIFVRIWFISAALKTIKNTLKPTCYILKTSIAQPIQRKHENMIDRFFLIC